MLRVNNRKKQRLEVAAIQEKIANTRLDQLHKTSTQIINEYDVICIEDLNVKGMMTNHKLAKHIGEASWGTLVSLLEYKAEWSNKQVVRIDRWFPSGKTCNECDDIHQDLHLSEREWSWPSGHRLDRKVNHQKISLLED